MVISNMLHEKVIRVLEEIGHTKRDQEMEAEVERGLQSVACYSHQLLRAGVASLPHCHLSNINSVTSQW